jgi:hypothetical protein
VLDGTPPSDSKDTKLCCSSRGVQSAAGSRAVAAIRRNPRRTCCVEWGAGFGGEHEVVVTPAWAGQLPGGGLSGSLVIEGVDAAAGQGQGATRFAESLALAAPEGYIWVFVAEGAPFAALCRRCCWAGGWSSWPA